MGKKSGGGGPQEVTQTTTNLPEYARPYVEEVLGRGVYESGRCTRKPSGNTRENRCRNQSIDSKYFWQSRIFANQTTLFLQNMG